MTPIPDGTFHASITIDRVIELVQRRMSTLEDPGLCTACGFEASQCEPDARHYECEACGERAVFAPEELLMEWGPVD